MKRVLLLLMGCLLSLWGRAETATVDGRVWSYTVENGSATITGGSSMIGSVTLPSMLSGYNVTMIGDNAFRNVTGLTSVTIPEGVIKIGRNAFSGCSGLTFLSIPSTVTDVDDAAFGGCTAVKELVFLPKEAINIESDSFRDLAPEKLTAVHFVKNWPNANNISELGAKSSVKTLVIPAGTETIPTYAFRGFKGITEITIPEGVKRIETSAFAYCTSLKSVTFPSNAITLIAEAFVDCTQLCNLNNFGNHVTWEIKSDGAYPFTGCTSFPKDALGVVYGDLARTILLRAPYAIYGGYTLSSTVKQIACRAFADYLSGSDRDLTSVTIPEGVTNIGNSAFQGCSNLTSVTFPSSLTSVGYCAFKDCSQLKSVYISDLTAWCSCQWGDVEVPEKGADLYLNGKLVTDLIIPQGVTTIGSSVFLGCSSLTSVTIPSSVTNIGRGAFRSCSGLTSVTISEGVTSISANTFYGCSGLTSVTIPSGVTTIGGSAFGNCTSLLSVTIPSSVTSIESGAFMNCSGLRAITFQGPPPTVVIGEKYKNDSFPTTLGFYPSSRAAAWKAVIDENGNWANLSMTEYSSPSVKLTFNANGGTGGSSGDYVVGMDLQAPTVSREGYTFKGWSPSVPSEVPETATTYTAQWQVNQYRMTFNANGGTGGQTLTLNYGSQITAPQVEREGYTLTGWNPSLPRTVPAANKTFVAQWKINQYTQTFDANGGEGGAILTQDYDTALVAPTVTREGCAFVGWDPEVPSTVPAQDVTYTAKWKFVAPTWASPETYQNNMTVYAQVKDTTTDRLIESAGSLLAAFDSNGQCRGVATVTTGPTGKLYQLTACSNSTSGEVLKLKIWDAATGETIDIGETISFVSDGKVGSLPAPKVYTVGQIALDLQLKTGWNWLSVNVELPTGTTLSELFKDWTPCDEDVIKSATATATYYDGVWYPEDFALEPGKMYQIKNSVTDPVTIRLLGAPVPSTTEIAVKAGWNWLGYTGTSPVDVATAFSADTTFTDEDLLKSGTTSATYYGGQWWGDLMLEPGKGYKLQAANATTIKYVGAAPATASVALLSVRSSPNWTTDECQYNMTVYASVKDGAGNAFEAAGSMLGAFDAKGVCRSAVVLGNGPRGKLYQLTVGSDSASGETFTLKVWDATSGQVYDIEQTIIFVSDGAIGSIVNPQVYTAIVTANSFAVTVDVVGNGTITGTGDYAADETVILTATPSEGYLFCGWSTTPVIMDATYSFTMPEAAVSVTAYFAPVAALNAYVNGQGFVSADAVNAKIQAYIEENNLKTPEEVEAAIDAHVAENGLLTPAEANQQTQDYIADNKLMSKDEAKQELLDADEVFTADEMKALALGAPVIQVKNGKATVSIQVKQASKLDGEWEVVEDGEVSVEITPKAGEKAAFYKFIVPDEQ